MSDFKKVLKVRGNAAWLEDGRIVRLGPLKDVESGQYLEVYADIALAKVDINELGHIEKSREESNVS